MSMNVNGGSTPIWSEVVYTQKSDVVVDPNWNQVSKTGLWEMPSATPTAPVPATEQWEMPEIKGDSSTIPARTPEQASQILLTEVTPPPLPHDWLSDILKGLDEIAAEPKPAPQPEAKKPEPQPEPKPIAKKPEPQPEPKPIAKKPEPKPEPKPIAKKPEPKPEPKPIPAEGRTFKTQGDPLVRTGDGMWFGVHEPGKYVSLKSASGDFLMEQQISKTKDGRKYNTGMGFKLDGNNIAISTNGGNGPNTMTINGKKYDLKFAAHGINLPGGGKVTYDPKTSKVNITSADGDKISINRVNNAKGVHYLNAEVELSAKRPSGSVHGLLGSLDADTNAANDTRGRDGKAIAVNGTTKLDMNDGRLWKTPEDFAKEWRTRSGEGVL